VQVFVLGVMRSVWKAMWARSLKAVECRALTLHVLPVIICHGWSAQPQDRGWHCQLCSPSIRITNALKPGHSHTPTSSILALNMAVRTGLAFPSVDLTAISVIWMGGMPYIRQSSSITFSHGRTSCDPSYFGASQLLRMAVRVSG
jgi:hypothetical protein